ncbi:MAG: hypothetical protein JSV51_01375 [Candidatus Bathyarchaeota archaeon]|nr:MAG: hypothetical protein JSV51_01375 [Candidatus Bathyarchaeota archaeon]
MKHRSFRDRDFLSTKEGFIFCVVGPYHPIDRIVSYLKYLPNPKGKWRKGQEKFKRVMLTYTIPSLTTTFDLLKNAYPQYLFFSKAYNITMTAVPQGYLVKHFRPEDKMVELIEKSRLDPLQKKVVHLVSILFELSNVPAENFGVTGSILLDMHNPTFSDIDITIYGVESSYAVKNALTIAYSTKESPITRFEGEKLKKWYMNRTQNRPISLADAKRIYERKWNIGLLDKTPFSVHPVKLEEELTERYGDKTFHPCETVTLQAVVADSIDTIFLPAVYRVRDVKIENDIDANIKEVVSYEGLFDSLAGKGEIIKAKGKLEHVVDNQEGTEYDRVLIGSIRGKGTEYIKPIV